MKHGHGVAVMPISLIAPLRTNGRSMNVFAQSARCTAMHSDAQRCTAMHSDAQRCTYLPHEAIDRRVSEAMQQLIERTLALKHKCSRGNILRICKQICHNVRAASDTRYSEFVRNPAVFERKIRGGRCSNTPSQRRIHILCCYVIGRSVLDDVFVFQSETKNERVPYLQ
jgi:hypothetical protein